MRRRKRGTLGAALAFALLAPGAASGFALIQQHPSPNEALTQAARWSPGFGLEDGIQVGLQPGLASLLAFGSDPAVLEQAISDAILPWENGALRFDIVPDAAVEGTSAGLEIDIFAVPNDHPVFIGNGFFGATIWQTTFLADRPISNGQSSPGYAIVGADLYINLDQQAFLSQLGLVRIPILTRILMHEVGHAIGLHHPNDDNPIEGALTNFDTDGDPTTAMFIDPSDPTAGLFASPNTDNSVIMSNTPCGPNPTMLCLAVLFDAPQNDDRGGRDFLYPVPEPSTAPLLALGLGGLTLARKRQPHRRITNWF